MQVQSVVQSLSLEFFFLAKLLWRGVAVSKKRAKVKPRFRSSLQALSSEKILNIDPGQKQLKLEETDNAIIKSILSTLWQNFLIFILVLTFELRFIIPFLYKFSL